MLPRIWRLKGKFKSQLLRVADLYFKVSSRFRAEGARMSLKCFKSRTLAAMVDHLAWNKVKLDVLLWIWKALPDYEFYRLSMNGVQNRRLGGWSRRRPANEWIRPRGNGLWHMFLSASQTTVRRCEPCCAAVGRRKGWSACKSGYDTFEKIDGRLLILLLFFLIFLIFDTRLETFVLETDF